MPTHLFGAVKENMYNRMVWIFICIKSNDQRVVKQAIWFFDFQCGICQYFASLTQMYNYIIKFYTVNLGPDFQTFLSCT